MKFLIITSAAISLAIAPAAMAGPGGNGNGKGHGMGGPHKAAVAGHPAGHVKVKPVTGGWSSGAVPVNAAGRTHPHGMPPGQAKKLAAGGVLASTYPGYQRLSSYNRYGLAKPPAGYEYVRVGDDAYLRQSRTGVISRVIENLFH